jgi:DNA-binding FrmR family transcriptional regulator
LECSNGASDSLRRNWFAKSQRLPSSTDTTFYPLLNRVRRIRGQVEAIERALDRELGCAEVLQLVTGARGAINGLMGEVIDDHIRMHLADPTRHPDAEAVHAADKCCGPI